MHGECHYFHTYGHEWMNKRLRPVTILIKTVPRLRYRGCLAQARASFFTDSLFVHVTVT